MMELVLRERGGPIAVTPDEWLRLRLETTVGELARHGILRLERTSAAILLFPSHYVGEMHSPGVRLAVQPKNKPLYQALLTLALGFDGKQSQDHEGEIADEEGDDLVSPFVRALADCVEEGLPWAYEAKIEATSRPRGKPQFAKTIAAFVARGVMHKVVAGHQERHQSEDFATVVWSAVRCLPEAPGATSILLQRATVLAEALPASADCSLTTAIELAESLLSQSRTHSEKTHALLQASLALLDRDGRRGVDFFPLPVGVARFVNLERIWERAVGNLIAMTPYSVDANVTLHGLSFERLRLFGEGGPTIDPDVVVRSEDGGIGLIADAKYKQLSDSERNGFASDVYQLTCYIERTKAKRGMLVYVGSSDSIAVLGKTHTGARVIVARISAERITSDGQYALAHIIGQE